MVQLHLWIFQSSFRPSIPAYRSSGDAFVMETRTSDGSLPNRGINFKDVYHIKLNKNSGFHSHTFCRSVLYSDLRGVERGRLLKCIDEHAPYRAVSAFDKATNGIREFLEYCEFPDEQLDDIESLLVNDVGVSSLEDLEFVGEDDLQNAGMYVKVNSPLYVNV